MDALGTAVMSVDSSQRLLDSVNLAMAEGHITPEIVSTQALAETQMEAQTKILKQAIEAETKILDLLA